MAAFTMLALEAAVATLASCQSWGRSSKATVVTEASLQELASLQHKLLWSHWPTFKS